MRVVDGDLRAEGHDKSRPEDRQVERFPVVGGACAKGQDLLAQGGDERRLGADVVQEVLPEDELPGGEVGDADQEDVRPGAAREARGLGVEEEDVLPPIRRRTAKPEVGDEQRIDGSPPDDLDLEIVDIDPPFVDRERL